MKTLFDNLNDILFNKWGLGLVPWLAMEVFLSPCHKLVLKLGADKTVFHIKSPF